jgi:hypothetical protein
MPPRGSHAYRFNGALDGVEHQLTIVRQERIHGSQAYWLCNQCGSLRWHLYIRGGEISCRKCLAGGLIYSSQRTRHGVALRARKIRRRLAAPPGLLSELPARPKHWRRDYWSRALAELAQAEGVLAVRLRDIVGRRRKRA